MQPPFITGNYYHIFNRGIDRRQIFTSAREYKLALSAMNFYLSSDKSLRLSYYLAQNLDSRVSIDMRRQQSLGRISLVSYCLMSNHFHLLVRQEVDDGIYDYMRMVQSSISHRFNLKHQRKGSVFEGVFKAVHIETSQQLLHVSRYIHLNPYSASIVSNDREIVEYPWSSFRHYCNLSSTNNINTSCILEDFKSPRDYMRFVLDQANYQRDLKKIDHLTFE